MWIYIIIILFFLLIITSLILITKYIYHLINKKVINKTITKILSIIPLLLFSLGFYFNMVNTLTIYLHLIIIISLTKILFYLIKKITNKEISEFIILNIGIFLTTLILSYGYYLAHHIYQTFYSINTSKNIYTDNFRIIQISDSHISNTINGQKFNKYVNDINKLNPDLVVLTGDIFDDDTTVQDMLETTKALNNLKSTYGVYFIYGNHDKGYFNNRGFDDSDIRLELNNNNVTILEDNYVSITDNIVLIGRKDRSDKTRQEAYNLTKDIDKNKYIIMLDHQPNDYNNEIKSQADLVLSGHTHGGQLFPLGPLGLLIKANDKIYGLEKRENTNFIVTSGIGGWALKFKTGTISEYNIIDIKNN